MTLLVLKDATVLVGGADISGRSNEVELATTAADLDATNFRSNGWRERVAGLRSSTLEVKGFFDAGTISLPDDVLNDVGETVAVSVSPELPVVGGVAFSTNVVTGAYKWGDQVGKLLPFEAKAEAAMGVVRGSYASVGTKIATGVGTGLNLGAVPAGSRLVAALHVFAVTGTTPTLDVTVQSDDANTFASPTAQLTFAQVGGSGAGSSQLISVGGLAGTETWFRVSYTIGGTASPSFDFIVTLGIGPI